VLKGCCYNDTVIEEFGVKRKIIEPAASLSLSHLPIQWPLDVSLLPQSFASFSARTLRALNYSALHVLLPVRFTIQAHCMHIAFPLLLVLGVRTHCYMGSSVSGKSTSQECGVFSKGSQSLSFSVERIWRVDTWCCDGDGGRLSALSVPKADPTRLYIWVSPATRHEDS